MTYDREKIAGCLRANRARVRKSRAEIAEIVKIPASTIESYELAKATPSLENAWKLADYYGKGLDELFEHEIRESA